jgi:proton-dependent oligopeptide transporter, POT family
MCITDIFSPHDKKDSILRPHCDTEHAQKHPVSLWFLSSSYALFIFAYAAINTLLVLYTTHKLNFKTSDAYSLFAAFNALVFTSPLAGGYIAEKFGYKNSAFMGLIFSALGAFVMTSHGLYSFYIGLALFTSGYGICTPAFFCLVGFSYHKNDSRRESGYTLFYLLFNIGSVTASVSAGYISLYLNYYSAFACAGIALVIAVLILLMANKKITSHPERQMSEEPGFLKLKPSGAIAFFSIVLTPLIMFLFAYPTINNALLWFLVIAATIIVSMLAIKQPSLKARLKLFAFMLLTIISIVFWALYMLEASLMTIFAEHNVNRYVFHHVIPPSVFYALDPAGVIIFGILLSWLWRYLAKRKKNPSLPAKFSLSMIFIGIGYIVFAIGILAAKETHLINLLWIVFGYVFLTIAELLLVPIGLSMVGQLSPRGKEGSLMGVWTLFSGFGAIISGYLANFTTTSKITLPSITNPTYLKYFLLFGGVSILAGLITACFIPKIRKLIESRGAHV